MDLLVGLGRSSAGLALHLSGSGRRLRICDRQPEGSLRALVERLPQGVELRLGGYDESVLEGVEVVYASPGVWWDDPLLEAARARGLRVSSELDLFLRICPAPIVGITGTNGKTTTTAMTAAVLRRGDRPVLVGGNVGETVIDRLGEVTPDHLVVLELSSFQIESIERPHVHVAVVLNVTPDHLDRHGTFERYAAVKRRLVEALEPDDWALLNGRDPTVRRFAGATRGRVVWFDEGPPPPGLRVPGRHNVENAQAAAAAGRALGIPESAIAGALAEFPGVEHRIELVGEWGGVRWYNDSKATNPESGVVALRSFPDQPLVLIAGGRGSGFELAEWLAEVRRSARAVVLMGESAPELEAALAGGPPLARAPSLEAAVETAGSFALPGDVVLLSPGYKSFDMFRDYEDRGRRFKELVRERHGDG